MSICRKCKGQTATTTYMYALLYTVVLLVCLHVYLSALLSEKWVKFNMPRFTCKKISISPNAWTFISQKYRYVKLMLQVAKSLILNDLSKIIVKSNVTLFAKSRYSQLYLTVKYFVKLTLRLLGLNQVRGRQFYCFPRWLKTILYWNEKLSLTE